MCPVMEWDPAGVVSLLKMFQTNHYQYTLFNINGVQEQFCKHMYFHLMLTPFYVGYMGGWHSPSVKLLNPGCTACASESGLPLNNLSGGLHGSKHVYFQWAPPLVEDL